MMMPYRRIPVLAASALALLAAPYTLCLAGDAVWDLDRVVSTALANHPLVGQADAEILAAGARKGQAESARYPSIDLSAGYSRSRTFSSSSLRSSTASSDFLQGTLSQVITDFGRTGSAVDRADAQLSSTRETGRSVREDVAFAAKVAYYNVLRARRIVEVSRETVKQRESLLRQAQAYYDAGIRARIDVARAEANLFQARAETTAAGNDLQVARITLLTRMGVDGPRDFELKDTLATEALPGSTEEWLKEAEGNRPDLRALQEKERAAAMSLRGARAGYNPVLTGNGGYGYAAEDFPLEQNYSLSVQLAVPVFSGFLTRRQVAEAQAQLASARYAVTDMKRLVRLQVEQAALSVGAAVERTGARRKEREASEENLRLATARYEVGAGDIIEMIDAQVQMTRSDTSMIEALYDSSVSIAALQRAIGR
ncbi:MAG: TolC family protein [Deltaproteobacteria bacterium]|nr:TolC family protein [Deltaproteobacteria bacterium]